MAETREREQRFSDRMSDHEALMWNIEKDPWLNPSGASLTILDAPIDKAYFERTMRRAVVKMPRLYERVVPALGRLAPPAWVPDPEFDLDAHVRHLRLEKPGTERQLYDLAAQLYQEPLDRTRPLWRFVLIEGLKGGRSAIWSIVHHSVSDGIGQLRMAEMYQQVDPDTPPPDDVDLEAIVAAAVEAHHAKQLGGDLTDGLPNAVGQSLAHLVRRQLGQAVQFEKLFDTGGVFPVSLVGVVGGHGALPWLMPDAVHRLSSRAQSAAPAAVRRPGTD